MGGVQSTCFKEWEKKPQYRKFQDTLKHADRDIQSFVEDFITYQNKVCIEKDILKSQNDNLMEDKAQLLAQNKMLSSKDAKIKLSTENKPQKQQKREGELSRAQSLNDTVLDDCLDEQRKLQIEITRLKHDKENLFKENNSLKNENKILSDEKESALSRLSKIAGIQLTKGNSEIADLSDANRPTSLAEKWASLYTDEWSEAYDELRKTVKNENYKLEKELCRIAQKCYTICVEIEKKQMKDIKSHTWDIACGLHQQPDQLVAAVQTTQYHKFSKEAVDKKQAATMTANQIPNIEIMGRKIRSIQKCMEELIQIVHERRKYDKGLLDYVVQEAVGHFGQYQMSGSKGQVIKFVKRCTELCWSMVIKEPQMTLVYDQLEGKPIDKTLFSVYTKNGSIIDFVVWPALILHKTGPILAKGAVQGREISTTEVGKQMTDSKTTHNKEETTNNAGETCIVHSTKGHENIHQPTEPLKVFQQEMFPKTDKK